MAACQLTYGWPLGAQAALELAKFGARCDRVEPVPKELFSAILTVRYTLAADVGILPVLMQVVKTYSACSLLRHGC